MSSRNLAHWGPFLCVWETIQSNGSVNVTTQIVPERVRHDKWRWQLGGNPIIRGWRNPSPFTAFQVSYVSTNTFKETRATLGRRRYISCGVNQHGLGSTMYHRMTALTNDRRRPNVSSNTVNRAVTQALAKANRNQMEIGVALGESREALSLVRKSLYRLVRAGLLLKRGKVQQLWKEFRIKADNSRKRPSALAQYGQDAVRRSGGLWLEASFGWKPLFNDVQDALLLWEKGIDRRQLVKCTSLVRDEIPHPTWPTWADTIVVGNPCVGEESAFVRLDFQIDDEQLQYLKQLGLNPVSVGWELIPFSFLVDYVVPIGTMLQAAAGTFGLTCIGQSLTKKVDYTLTWRAGTSPAEGTFVDGVHSLATVKGKAVERDVSFALVPRIYWTDPFSTSNRVGNIAALITQLAR